MLSILNIRHLKGKGECGYFLRHYGIMKTASCETYF